MVLDDCCLWFLVPATIAIEFFAYFNTRNRCFKSRSGFLENGGFFAPSGVETRLVSQQTTIVVVDMLAISQF